MDNQTEELEIATPSVMEELAELRHFKDSLSGLWCVDKDPKEQSIEWIRENAFQIT